MTWLQLFALAAYDIDIWHWEWKFLMESIKRNAYFVTYNDPL